MNCKCNFYITTVSGKSGAKTKELFIVFVDLEKGFDCMPREVIQLALRHEKVPLVMALYSNARSRVRTLASTSDEFGIGVGVHQGLELSLKLVVVVMQEEPERQEVKDYGTCCMQIT